MHTGGGTQQSAPAPTKGRRPPFALDDVPRPVAVQPSATRTDTDCLGCLAPPPLGPPVDWALPLPPLDLPMARTTHEKGRAMDAGHGAGVREAAPPSSKPDRWLPLPIGPAPTRSAPTHLPAPSCHATVPREHGLCRGVASAAASRAAPRDPWQLSCGGGSLSADHRGVEQRQRRHSAGPFTPRAM